MSAPLVFSMTHSDRMAGSIPVWAPATGATAAGTAATAAGGNDSAFGFHDLLNIVNPLQHIPVVSELYRHFTGDTIKPVSQVLGDTLFGGPIGGMVSFINMLSTQATGHTLSGVALQAIEGKQIALNPPAKAMTGGAPNDSADSATLIRYADLGNGKRLAYERVSAADDRMAGTMVRIREEDAPATAVPNVVVPVGQPDTIHPVG